jgi:deaminated glutathione amidase
MNLASEGLPFAQGERIRAAAIQYEPLLGDVERNLERAELLARQAGDDGAQLIVLPEFFSTGMAFEPRISDGVLPVDGPATQLLLRLARDYKAVVGGSFLCTGDEPRNAFVLVGPHGVLGRHDKDIPTLWEHCFYVGGDDPGRIGAGVRFGVAMCWEFMRRPTAVRLREQVDCVVGGSAWWSTPHNWWARPFEQQRRRNGRNAIRSVRIMARLVGAPVVHAAMCGAFQCRLLGTPLPYQGQYEGGALVASSDGTVLAARHASQGEGIAVAEVELASSPAEHALPDRYWLYRRGLLAALSWHYQGWRGRRWREQRAVARPSLEPRLGT